MSQASTERFSDRAADYKRYRPDYPDEVLRFLSRTAGLQKGAVIADIGSGTGIFTRHLLQAGYRVYAVEPNDAMRGAAEDTYRACKGFVSVTGTAATTGLEAQLTDLIVCAQSFHWFNTAETKAEFQRILKKDGYVALIWNNRITGEDDFSIDYEALLHRLSPDYSNVNHQNLTEADFAAFFREGAYGTALFPNEQVFDAAGLAGRAFSSSYVPAAASPEGKRFADALRGLFIRHEQGGKVRFRYRTEVYIGRL